MNGASKGFTMIEVLIAVLVMGLVVTASLKLVAISERGLWLVREKEILIDEATKLQIFLMSDSNQAFQAFGISGDISWKIEEKKSPLWIDETIDLDNLMLESERRLSSGDKDALKNKEQRWRELEVTRKEQTLTLFLPYKESEGDGTSRDITTSGDRK